MVALLIVLLVLAVGLLCVEMFIPGFGVCGVLGLILLVFSAVLTVVYVPFGLLLVFLELCALGGAGFVGFRMITGKQLHGKLILDETLNEDTADIGDLAQWIGKEGVVLTPLRPFGLVDFNGVEMEVSSNGPFIEKNQKVKVSEVVKRKVIVKQIG